MTTKPFALTILLIVFTSAMASAQTTTIDTAKIPHAYWINLGFGAGTLGSLSGNLAVQAEVPKHLLITSSYQAETNHFALKSVGGGGHDVNIFTGNLLIGKVYKQPFSLYALSVGLSYIDMDIDDYYGTFLGAPPSTHSRRNTIGIPITIQGYIVGGQFAGIGINTYLNINILQTTAGVQLHAALGRIQTHKPRN